MAFLSYLRLVGVAAALACSASAEYTGIDFIGLTSGGYISYAGRSAPLVGSGIHIDRMLGINTPLHDVATEMALNPSTGGGFTVENGSLNFQTGGFVTRETDGTFVFSGGGFFTVTGSVRDQNGGYIISDPNTVLLQGGLLGAQLDRVGSIKLTIVNGTDTKHPDVVSWFGLPPDTQFAFSGTITSRAQVDSSGRYAVLQSQITNSVVPEPPTVSLLASMVCFVIALVGRKRSKRHV